MPFEDSAGAQNAAGGKQKRQQGFLTDFHPAVRSVNGVIPLFSRRQAGSVEDFRERKMTAVLFRNENRIFFLRTPLLINFIVWLNLA